MFCRFPSAPPLAIGKAVLDAGHADLADAVGDVQLPALGQHRARVASARPAFLSTPRVSHKKYW